MKLVSIQYARAAAAFGGPVSRDRPNRPGKSVATTVTDVAPQRRPHTPATLASELPSKAA